MSEEITIFSPPPPPLLPPPQIVAPLNQKTKSNKYLLELLNAKFWTDDEELNRACFISGVFTLVAPKHWFHEYFECLLQSGPTCGLVALSMLLRQQLNPDELLCYAKRYGYTINGEIFNARHMLDLCNYAKNRLKLENFSAKLCEKELTNQVYIEALLNGCRLLVPYDSDKNFSPCLNNGRSAHWALIMGILIKDSKDDLNNIYVTAKHGKSKHLALWKLKDLCESNSNLREVAEKCNDGFIIPSDGLDGPNGLCNKFILIDNNRNNFNVPQND